LELSTEQMGALLVNIKEKFNDFDPEEFFYAADIGIKKDLR
jgi:hypothetical protein